MIRIQSHARGLLVSVDDSNARRQLIRQLEERIGIDQVLIYKENLILSANSAAEVLDLLSPQSACWDERILKQAKKQMEHRQMQLRARIEVAQALEDSYASLTKHRLLKKLDAHQVDAVAAISVPSLKGMALFDEQGTGKTRMVLAAFDYLYELKKVKRLLVIAPKSVLGAWKGECESFLEYPYRIVVVDGSSTKRKRAIQNPHDILLISYDSTVREQGLVKMIVAADPASYMLVIDESYFIKNPKTIRAQVVAEIRLYCERAVILCGTPAPNSAIDIVNQINIADGGVAFANRTISKDAKEAETEIAQALEEVIYLRRLKEDVLPNIPIKQIEKLLLKLQPIQQEIYNRAKNELIIAVKNVNDREFTRRLVSFLAKRAALLQICSNPRSMEPLYNEEPAKLLALDYLLRELVGQRGKKVVIWSFFRYSLQAIVERYDHFGLVRIDGSVLRVEERLEAINRFQNDPTIRIFVGNAAAAGAGITLTASHHAIYESFSNQAAHYMQSVDRIHRRGQTNAVTYHVLLAKDTIEEREFERLTEKERSGRELLGDRYEQPMTRERFLIELEDYNN